MKPAASTKAPLCVAASLCAIVVILLYGFIPYTFGHLDYVTSVFGALWDMWWRFSDFQYGMAVPFLSAFVIYTRRKELAKLPIRGSWLGIAPIVFSLAVYWAGYRVDNQYLGFFSLQMLLASLVLWLLGWQWLKKLAFPLAFLVFTWPMPFLDNIVTFPLRMIMAKGSVSVLNTLGFGAVQNGSGIVSAATVSQPAGALFRVDVADPCSGIRSLFALMMITALYANFTMNRPWKKLLLFACSVPLALVGNIFRILLLTIGIMTLGSPTAIGTLEHPSLFHEAAGFAVFIVALSAVLFIGQLLGTPVETWRLRWRYASNAARPGSASIQRTDSSSDLY